MWSNNKPKLPNRKNSGLSVKQDGTISHFKEEDLNLVLKCIEDRRSKYYILDKDIEKEKDIVKELYQKGWAKIEGGLDHKIDTLNKISDKLNYFLDGGPMPLDSNLGRQVGENNNKLTQKEARDTELFLSIPEPLYNIPEISDIIFDNRLTSIAKSFFRCAPAIGTLNLRKSFANNLKSENTTMYHIDPNSPYFFKVFVYLKDVLSPEDGPFTYVEGSVDNKPDNILQKYRWEDDEIEAFYGKDKIKHITGKKGDVALAMTNGFHKGQKCIRNDRELLTIDYVCHPDSWNAKQQMSIKRETFENLPLNKIALADFLYVKE